MPNNKVREWSPSFSPNQSSIATTPKLHAAPQVNTQTFKENRGRVIAIRKSDGAVVASAENILKLKAKMEESFPEVEYRFLTCP